MADESRFDLLVKQNELTLEVATQLKQVLSTCDVILVCDDSGSMKSTIVEGNTNKQTTRWLELKKLAAVIIEFVTAINPNGLDIYFFNRPTLRNVTDLTGLQQTFNDLPNGSTPLIGTLRKIFRERANLPDDRQLLVIVITDGEPTDGNHEDLFSVLYYKPSNVHVSFAECTDNEEDMAYLDRWDGVIRNFDNTDDYREELARVKAVQGPQFKFDYTDYVIKILLATFVRWYFNLDQTQVSSQVSSQVRAYPTNQVSYPQVISQGGAYSPNLVTSPRRKKSPCCTLL
jgi:uncharacterized protein YegL